MAKHNFRQIALFLKAFVNFVACFGVISSLFLVESASARQSEAGPPVLGRNGYVEYWIGDMPLIISAPHGGSLTPEEIEDRTTGTTVTDSNTKQTALAFREAVYSQTGHYPYVIISNLKRTKLDPNREIVEAAAGNQWAEQAWNEYHGFIDTAKQLVEDQFGEGFYVDVHGHAHPIQRLELGYLLNSSQLSQSDGQLDWSGLSSSSSISSLVNSSSFSFSELLRGPASLGALFESGGIPATPSDVQPSPGANNPFFNGGYSTWRHGSMNGGTISGVQIEAYRIGLRDTASSRSHFASVFAQVIKAFLFQVYDWAGIASANEPQPSSTELPVVAYPNPTHESVTLQMDMRRPSTVYIRVFDSLGRVVSEKWQEPIGPGQHDYSLDLSPLPIGVYHYVVRSSEMVHHGSLIKQQP